MKVRALESKLGLGLGLEDVFVFDSKSENRDGAVEAVEVGTVGLGLERLRERARVDAIFHWMRRCDGACVGAEGKLQGRGRWRVGGAGLGLGLGLGG